MPKLPQWRPPGGESIRQSVGSSEARTAGADSAQVIFPSDFLTAYVINRSVV
jgi:hypothetical protein